MAALKGGSLRRKEYVDDSLIMDLAEFEIAR